MEPHEIKEIFDKKFNGLPNPIFCYPLKYFEYNGYLCEVAAANKLSRLDFNRVKKNPWNVFDALFVDDGLWITVLKKQGEDILCTELSDHINNQSELDSFLTRLK